VRFVVILTVAALAAAVSLPAGAEARSNSSGVLGSIDAAPDASIALQGIVVQAFALQIERRNVTFSILNEKNLQPSNRASAGLQKAAQLNAQYLMLGEYSTAQQRLTLVVDLYDAETGRKLGSASATRTIGLDMDTVAADVLDHLLVGLPLRSRPQPLQPDTEVTGPPVAAAIPPSTGARATVPGEAARTTQLVAVSVGVAPSIPLGKSSYFDLGVLASVSAVYRFPLGPGRMGVGVFGAADSAQVSGAAASGTLLLVPVGPEIRYFMNEGGFPGIVVHASAGPALMNVTTAYDGSLTKPVPYLLVGMSVSFPFAASWGLAFDATWAAFFESQSLFLTTFAPEVAFYARF